MKLFNAVLVSFLIMFSATVFADNGSGGTTTPPKTPTPVKVTETYPDAAIVAPPNSSIYVALSDLLGVDASASMLTLTDAKGKTIAVKSATLLSNGSAIVFTPAAPLTASSKISASISSDGITTYAWTFQTTAKADTTLPKVLGSVPANLSLGNDPTQPLIVAFSQRMNPVSFVPGNITAKSNGVTIEGTFAFNFDLNQLTFTANNTFGYRAKVDVVLGQFTDMDGNALATDPLSFTTATTGEASFATNSADSFIVPTGVYLLYVNSYGAGGGAGSGCSSGVATNGGDGGWAYGVIVVSPGQEIGVTVGSGGSGGSSGTGGGDGGNSFITVNNVATVIALGGGGGFGESVPTSSGCSAGTPPTCSTGTPPTCTCSCSDGSTCSTGSSSSTGGTCCPSGSSSGSCSCSGGSTGTCTGGSTGTCSGGTITSCSIGYDGLPGYVTIGW